MADPRPWDNMTAADGKIACANALARVEAERDALTAAMEAELAARMDAEE